MGGEGRAGCSRTEVVPTNSALVSVHGMPENYQDSSSLAGFHLLFGEFTDTGIAKQEG